MKRRLNPPFPTQPFGLLLVEGGDEVLVSKAVAGPKFGAELVIWKAEGRDDLPELAQLATMDPSFGHARSVGVLLDAEDDLNKAQALARRILEALGSTSGPPVHGVLAGQSPKLGVFLAPDGQQLGSIEKLCIPAVRNQSLSSCVDAFLSCAGAPHSTQALKDKGWLNAYLSMLSEPLRFYQAFEHPQGIDPNHSAFDALRAFLQSL